MNGATGGDDSVVDEGERGTDHDGSERDDGSETGFEFGPERVDAKTDRPNDRSHPERGSASDPDRRIRVDLPSSEPDGPSRSDDPDRPPGGDPPGPEPGPEPGPNAVRNWSALLFGLAVVSVATAGVTAFWHDDAVATAGALVLASVFAGIAVGSRRTTPSMLESLDAAWIEHRRYAWFAAGLFAFGTGVGIVLLVAGVNLLEIIAELFDDGLFPELEDEDFELTATFFIRHNTPPFLMSIVGALSLGLLTAFIMFFNGVVVGNVSAIAGDAVGVDYILVGLAPHGIFELSALFVASGIGFRLVHRFVDRILGRREALFTKRYVYRTLALVGFAWLVLVLAAFVEAYITPELLEILFADRLAELESTTDSNAMP
ncbi:stage II sporulation protein M [Natrarchaeobius halalkaliphilus]|uniref:Stage II sporulation protein M n=1 Tax=Natrarchaeobius halalkaliphilus TaxID=1679091 RepID=A0A3N6LN28_9EURY|nr:stage II sporulation protein M [Natrarchaeobius halalkaliphilus]RQG86975.1 stage II sporulation protein M [Natrarchaeobius halalkaliphilus]